jgi:hypothetical protein
VGLKLREVGECSCNEVRPLPIGESFLQVVIGLQEAPEYRLKLRQTVPRPFHTLGFFSIRPNFVALKEPRMLAGRYESDKVLVEATIGHCRLTKLDDRVRFR